MFILFMSQEMGDLIFFGDVALIVIGLGGAKTEVKGRN